MSQPNQQLHNVITNLHALADALQVLADSMEHENQEATAPTVSTPPTKPQKPVFTLVDVRTILGEKANAGFSEDVRNLLHKYGASKLSAVSPEQYPALLKDAEAIGHATE
jgi:hypothetical protein